MHPPGRRNTPEAASKAILFSEANREMPGNEAERVKQGYPNSHIQGRVPPPCLKRLQILQITHPALPGMLKGAGTRLTPAHATNQGTWPVTTRAPSGVNDSTWRAPRCEAARLQGSHKKWGGVPDQETSSSEQQGHIFEAP